MSISIATIFEVFLMAMLINLALTIAYALYLIKEEKSITGVISPRRIFESSLMITGAITSAVWFFLMFIIFYEPLLYGAIASLVVVTVSYHHSHWLPSNLTEAVALGNIIAVSILSYLAGGVPLLAFAIIMIVTAFVVSDAIISLFSVRLA
jgi:hypothetical protein